MGLAGSGCAECGGVPVDHLSGFPASDPHEVRLVAAGPQPGVGEEVPQRVRVQPWHAGLVATAYQNLSDPGVGQRPSWAEPQFGPAGVHVLRPHPEVAVECGDGLVPDGHATQSTTRNRPLLPLRAVRHARASLRVSQPCQRMTGSMASAPIGSAHHQSNRANAPTPISNASDR